MLATLGDLVDDVVVHVLDPTNVASDTRAHIVRRRGGSAANVASSAARTGSGSRFLGQVGDDAIGAVLLAELSAAGVDVSHVVRVGTTGTIVVLVDPSGERTMLTDRRWCSSVGPPERSWLEGVDVLHVPLYSWQTAPLSDTATTLVRWAHESGIVVSIDLSSAAVLRDMGAVAVRTLLGRLAPEIVFANTDEADELGGPARFGAV
ncbi:MAG: carbohydrate kinase family protein, partial [Ilumatobacteraceae bacterium]